MPTIDNAERRRVAREARSTAWESAYTAYTLGHPSLLPGENRFKHLVEDHRWGKHGGESNPACPVCQVDAVPCTVCNAAPGERCSVRPAVHQPRMDAALARRDAEW